ncbi:hypothetical protein H4R34_004861 [Dimargaris verticillata]|uniref:ubiquitinyl hydrolase 1 n=1 Tax=Dimargaris verticillata TaxID=2761393 RepID=A0A9W8B1R1_9FUNG|nr:hypothetical protein H4R34_004861 [Dimargaris verticillata]
MFALPPAPPATTPDEVIEAQRRRRIRLARRLTDLLAPRKLGLPFGHEPGPMAESRASSAACDFPDSSYPLHQSDDETAVHAALDLARRMVAESESAKKARSPPSKPHRIVSRIRKQSSNFSGKILGSSFPTSFSDNGASPSSRVSAGPETSPPSPAVAPSLGTFGLRLPGMSRSHSGQGPSPTHPATGPGGPPRSRRESKETKALAKACAYLQQQYPALSEQEIRHCLFHFDGNSSEAIEYLEDLSLAFDGVVWPVDPLVRLRGAPNSRGTSCYLDSLFFAMFALHTAFDGLLFVRDEGSEPVHRLKISCRLLVNQLRQGKLVPALTVERVRSDLRLCGWQRSEGGGLTPPSAELPQPIVTGVSRPFLAPPGETQEDACELFLFLTTKLGLPFLPFEVRLHHGGDRTLDDERFVAERMVQLCIPEDSDDDDGPNDPSHSGLSANAAHPAVDPLWGSPPPLPLAAQKPLHLKDILLHHFYNNKVEDLQRPVYHKELGQKMQATDAWSMLELFPFYGPQNETGDILTASSVEFPDCAVVLPLMLKRYHVHPLTGALVKQRRPIAIPHVMEFTQFVNAATDDTATLAPSSPDALYPSNEPMSLHRASTAVALNERQEYPSAFGREGASGPSGRPEYHLVLKAAVCHKGSAPTSGHYITYVAQEAGQTTLPDLTAYQLWAQDSLGPSRPDATTGNGIGAKSTVSLPTLSTGPSAHNEIESAPIPPESVKETGSLAASGELPSAKSRLQQLAFTPGLANIRERIGSIPTAYRSTSTPPVIPTQPRPDTSPTATRALPSIESWIRFDDLGDDTTRVQRFSSLKNINSCFDDMAENAYLLFYQLYCLEPTDPWHTAYINQDRETALMLQHNRSP